MYEDMVEQRRYEAHDSGAGTSIPVSAVETATTEESSSGQGPSMSDDNRGTSGMTISGVLREMPDESCLPPRTL